MVFDIKAMAEITYVVAVADDVQFHCMAMLVWQFAYMVLNVSS